MKYVSGQLLKALGFMQVFEESAQVLLHYEVIETCTQTVFK